MTLPLRKPLHHQAPSMGALLGSLTSAARINAFAASLPRHPGQAFARHQADAEIVPLGDGRYLAATCDTVVEEIAARIYTEPRTTGWMAVQTSLSDLAAVGADPVGLLLNVNLCPEWDEQHAMELSSGVEHAARASRVPILGGDMNAAPSTSVGSCALGLLSDPLVSRTGMRPGDLLFATGRLGSGNALAAARLCGRPSLFPETRFRPRARLAEGRWLRQNASAMIDTSDGLFAALHQLADLNQVGVDLTLDPGRVLHPDALSVCKALGLPGWALLFGLLGEYELVAALPPQTADAMDREAVYLGQVTDQPGITFRWDFAEEAVDLDSACIVNLGEEAAAAPRTYLKHLLEAGRSAGLPTT